MATLSIQATLKSTTEAIHWPKVAGLEGLHPSHPPPLLHPFPLQHQSNLPLGNLPIGGCGGEVIILSICPVSQLYHSHNLSSNAHTGHFKSQPESCPLNNKHSLFNNTRSQLDKRCPGEGSQAQPYAGRVNLAHRWNASLKTAGLNENYYQFNWLATGRQ